MSQLGSPIREIKASSRARSKSSPRAVPPERRGYLVMQAMFRFIATEQEKPATEQQWSNLQDMRAMFNTVSAGGSRPVCR